MRFLYLSFFRGGGGTFWPSLIRVQWLNWNRTQSDFGTATLWFLHNTLHMFNCLLKRFVSSIWKIFSLGSTGRAKAKKLQAEFRIDRSFGDRIRKKWKICVLPPLQTILGLSTSKVWMKPFQNPSAPYMEPNMSKTQISTLELIDFNNLIIIFVPFLPRLASSTFEKSADRSKR